MKVYLVTSGEYSDYRIESAFATRELAEQAILQEMKPKDRENWLTNEASRYTFIEEYEVLESTERIETYYAWNDVHGKFHTRSELVYAALYKGEEESVTAHPAYPSAKIPKIWAQGRAMTKERALKIAQDARAKAKAEGLGL